MPKRSRADTLRGSFTTAGRNWWDVTFYDLHVDIRPNDSTIAGYNGITYKVLKPATEMQIDLMEPLAIDSMKQDGRHVRFRREGAAFFATLTSPQRAGDPRAGVAGRAGQRDCDRARVLRRLQPERVGADHHRQRPRRGSLRA